MHVTLTGETGTGKTHVLAILARRLGAKAGGVLMPRILEGERLMGYAIHDIATGRNEILAHRDFSHGMKLGPFRLQPGPLETLGIPALETALDRAEVLIIDEVGPLSSSNPGFLTLAELAAAETRPALFGAHSLDDPPLARRLAADSTVFRIEPGQDLEGLADGLLEAMDQEGFPTRANG